MLHQPYIKIKKKKFTSISQPIFLHKSQLPSSGVTNISACKGQAGDMNE